MAILNAYSLHDVKALTYSPPFYTANHALAKRMLQDLVADPNTQPGRHPSDFKLYWVGVFDDNNGDLQPLKIMEHVIDCVALVPPAPPSMFDKPMHIDPEWFRRAMAEESAKLNGEAK